MYKLWVLINGRWMRTAYDFNTYEDAKASIERCYYDQTTAVETPGGAWWVTK
jgi:hypothetical protein